MDEIEKLEKELAQRIKILSTVELPPNTIKALQSLMRRDRELRIEIRRINELVEKRERNVQLHFDSYYIEGRIKYSIHEDYHQITEELVSTYKNLFSKQTQLLHQVALVFQTILAHKQKTKLRFKSFGSFAKNLTNITGILSKPFIEGSQAIADIYLNYRDKKIEHFKDYKEEKNFIPISFEFIDSFPTFTLLEDSEVIQPSSNYKPTINQAIPVYSNTNPEYLEALKFRTNDGGELLSIHFVPLNHDVLTRTLKEGEVFGKNHIGNQDHLERFGIHGHSYFNIDRKIGSPYKVKKSSPGYHEMILNTLRFLSLTLKEITVIGKKLNYKD